MSAEAKLADYCTRITVVFDNKLQGLGTTLSSSLQKTQESLSILVAIHADFQDAPFFRTPLNDVYKKIKLQLNESISELVLMESLLQQLCQEERLQGRGI